jgi:hypothetical protein
MAAAAGGGPGVLPAAVHVQVRRLQPVLPGARGRAAGRAGDHGVLPGGVAVQVRQPALHAVRPVPPSEGGGSGRADGGLAGRCGDSPEAQQRRSGAVEPTLACAMLRAGCRVVLGLARRARARVWAGMRDLQGARGGDLPPHTHTHTPGPLLRASFFPPWGGGEPPGLALAPALPRGVEVWRAYGGSACVGSRRRVATKAAAGLRPTPLHVSGRSKC